MPNEGNPGMGRAWGVPAYLDPTLLNYFSGILVGVATNLLTSGLLPLPRVSLITSYFACSIFLLLLATALQRIKEQWEAGQTAVPFTDFLRKNKSSSRFVTWLIFFALAVGFMLASAVWNTRLPGS